MFGSTFRLGRVLGVEIKIDASWFFVAVLVTWSLAVGYFPTAHPNWSSLSYWLVGALTAALFFVSVLAHELAHSLVSRALGTPVHDITLFIFGGASRLEREPRRPRDELLMALAGPALSLVAGALFGALWWVSGGRLDALHALAGWLAWINVVLGLFNLVPGFPLDGGRAFRAIVWSLTRDLHRATRIAAGVGEAVGLGLIFVGVWQIFGGDWANGLWIAFIGWFLRSAAVGSVQRQLAEDLLAGHTVREVMLTDCPQLPARLTLDAAIDQIVLPSGRQCFPVVDAERVVGLLTVQGLGHVPRARWTATRVQDIMLPATGLHTVQPDDELTAVLERMTNEEVTQLPVVEAGQFVGVVSQDSLLGFIRLQAQASKPPHASVPAARP